MTSIRAPFTVAARPAEPVPDPVLPAVGLTIFDKVFVGGAFVGTSVVHMVSTAAASGPLAYVALERLEGQLDGRNGAFVLRHDGVILDGVPVLELEVVQGSATGDLVGLTGAGTIEHTAAGAFLELDYELPG